MLCKSCQQALAKTPTLKEGTLLFESLIYKIFFAMREEKCFLCHAIFKAIMHPETKFQDIFQDAVQAMHAPDGPRAPAMLTLGYTVRIRERPHLDALQHYPLVFDNVFHIECRFQHAEEFEPNKQITFLFSPIEPSQVADGTIKLGGGETDSNSFYNWNVKPYRALRSDNCPFCKEEGAEGLDEEKARSYYDDMSLSGEELRCGFEIDADMDLQFASDNTGSPESWRRIREWMEICDTTHSECLKRRQATKETIYPTRLLDLGLDSGEEDDPRLVLSREENLTGEYMTLSHCWGNLPIKVLTVDNIRDFRKKIAFSELSRTFQNAVVITRRLGIRYLWIDSLCIIQEGSKVDWHHESAMMDSIYQNSFLNIGATAASDGSKGCFQDRDYEEIFQPIVLKPACISHSEKYKQPYRLVEDSFWEDTIMSEPLLQRGWVFQERFLSPRMLHFGSQQLFWECNEMQVCESYPRHLLRAPPRVALDLLDPERLPQLHTILTQGRGQYRWHDIVEEYSSKKLTRAEDKLIALSGVARQYAKRMLPQKN